MRDLQTQLKRFNNNGPYLYFNFQLQDGNNNTTKSKENQNIIQIKRNQIEEMCRILRNQGVMQETIINILNRIYSEEPQTYSSVDI